MRVAVRVRPPIRADERARDSSALHCSGSTLWLVPKEGADEQHKGARQFEFDWVLNNAAQPDVFACTCVETDVVGAVLRGVNGCVMCYGQTGAGKTHTLGNLRPGEEGIVARALNLLFDHIAERGRTAAAAAAKGGAAAALGGVAEWSVQMAYVQIYMEVGTCEYLRAQRRAVGGGRVHARARAPALACSGRAHAPPPPR